MTNIIEVEKLKRVFKVSGKKGDYFEAVKGVTFTVKKGEIFGLLGPNGAGKTTIIKILTTMLAPTSGKAEIFGYSCFSEEKRIRDKINFVFGGERSLYWRLTAKDNLLYFADLYKIPREKQEHLVNELLIKVKLSEFSDKRVETFSKGMKQRLQIARALINKPLIIFFDEPSIGLDPVGTRDLKNIIVDLAKHGTTIFLTTHYMEEAQELCDRIAILKKGEIIALDSLDGLRKCLSDEDIKEIKENKLKELSKSDILLEDIYLKLIGGRDEYNTQ